MPVSPTSETSPPNILTLDPDKLEKFIDDLRERRMTSYHAYRAVLETAARDKSTKLRDEIAKQTEMWDKNLKSADSAIERLDKRVLRMRGILLELADLEEIGGRV